MQIHLHQPYFLGVGPLFLEAGNYFQSCNVADGDIGFGARHDAAVVVWFFVDGDVVVCVVEFAVDGVVVDGGVVDGIDGVDVLEADIFWPLEHENETHGV